MMFLSFLSHLFPTVKGQEFPGLMVLSQKYCFLEKHFGIDYYFLLLQSTYFFLVFLSHWKIKTPNVILLAKLSAFSCRKPKMLWPGTKITESFPRNILKPQNCL